jgi:uncharacterized protein YkwD
VRPAALPEPAVAAALALLLAAFATPAATAQATALPRRADPAVATLREINRVRAARGLVALRRDPRLARAARAHSREMVARRYFGHRSADGTTFVMRIAATGWLQRRGRWHVAENLAWGTGRLAAPRAVVAAWMASRPHRRHLLEPTLRLAGIGVAQGTPFTAAGATYTADLGSAR